MRRQRLPIHEIEGELVRRLAANRRLVLTAPTGSGKSTQVPQLLLQHGLLGNGQVVILQPRRLAARLLAARVADELGVELGREVGYQIRFENRSGPRTRIKFVTEGILLRQMIRDAALEGVSTLIFDEFHERHLYGDITLARALQLQERSRPELTLLVMSATLDSGSLRRYLDPCGVLSAEGRQHPIQTEYTLDRGRTDARPVWERAADAFAGEVRGGLVGDALIFMPGGYEISRTLDAFRRCPEAKGYLVLPLHGELPPTDQDRAVAQHDRPKIVVATNVAETSLTIDGIRLVIDSGLARIPRHDPARGINTLFVEPISRAAAEQRAGRAGRTAPGKCIRLWSEEEQAHRAPRELPEIKRLDLAEVVLTLKVSGVHRLDSFRWLEAPDPRSLAHAEELLTDLGALDSDGAPTALGRKLLAFPLHPRYSRMLLTAADLGCCYHAALAAALTQGRELLLRKVDSHTSALREQLLGKKNASDFFLLMRAWQYAAENQFRLEACRKIGIHANTARQVGPLLDHFLRIAQREGLDATPHAVSDENLRKCILTGFPDRVARRLDSGTLRCELVHGRRGVLVRESTLHHSPLFVAAEIREIEGKDKTVNTFLSLATAIEAEWLNELFPGSFTTRTRTHYDPSTRRVLGEVATCFRDLALAVKPVEPPPDEASRLLAREVFAGRLRLKHWDNAAEQWVLRLNSLAKWQPELALPEIGDEDRLAILEQLCLGALCYRDIKDRPVKSVLTSWLSAAQLQVLDQQTPERLLLSNGRRPRVTYLPDAPPTISLRIQELYDITETPRVACGRIPVTVQILGPNMRPVQVTQDLSRFWSEHYPGLKQELQRKYPKHEWR